jgi:hypothetical protein
MAQVGGRTPLRRPLKDVAKSPLLLKIDAVQERRTFIS